MRNLSLTRQCLGLVTRIECSIRPLAGDNGMWTLLFAAGMAGEQPSAIKRRARFMGTGGRIGAQCHCRQPDPAWVPGGRGPADLVFAFAGAAAADQW